MVFWELQFNTYYMLQNIFQSGSVLISFLFCGWKYLKLKLPKIPEVKIKEHNLYFRCVTFKVACVVQIELFFMNWLYCNLIILIK